MLFKHQKVEVVHNEGLNTLRTAEFVGELCAANPSVPVLVLIRLEDSEERERFLEAGASEVLSKEITFAEFLAAVRRPRGEG